jgi:hypothetical protein
VDETGVPEEKKPTDLSQVTDKKTLIIWLSNLLTMSFIPETPHTH